jgi:hypothetical protein
LLLLFLLALSAALAQSRPKRQDELPKALLLARYAYVQALDGDRFDLRLPEDRQAIFDVEDALHTWHRYSITLKRHDADLTRWKPATA